MRPVAILHHPRIPESLALAEELAEDLKAKGLEPWLTSAWEEKSIAERAKALDLLITLGGDGTVLRAARAAAPYGVPILAINMGHLGFLAEADEGQAKQVLSLLLKGKSWLEERAMLHARLLRQKKDFEALNDIFVGRGMVARALHLKTSLDGRLLSRYIADGIIVATATGSTAYNLAVGGPVLDPSLPNLLLTPIAPHLSATHSLVLPPESVVEIEIETDQPAIFTADGQIHEPLADGDKVEVTRSKYSCHLVRIQPKDYFYRTLMERLR